MHIFLQRHRPVGFISVMRRHTVVLSQSLLVYQVTKARTLLECDTEETEKSVQSTEHASSLTHKQFRKKLLYVYYPHCHSSNA